MTLFKIVFFLGWFSFDNIHECELRFLPEFFDGKSTSKNPRVYMYYRNSIVRKFRENPTTKITFTEARKTIIGDVGSVRRIFDFLEAWGLVNYSPPPASKLPLKWDDKETKSITALLQSTEPTVNVAECMVPKKKLCSGCKSVCSIACFASDKVINQSLLINQQISGWKRFHDMQLFVSWFCGNQVEITKVLGCLSLSYLTKDRI